ASEAEDRAPDAVEVHGKDRRFDTLHDALHTAAEGEELADASQLAFGENADEFAVLQGLRGFAKRMNHFAWALVRRNRNDAKDSGERLDEGMLVDVLEHQEANGTVESRNEEDGVGHRDVIGSEQRTTARGDVLAAFDVEAVKRMGGEPEEQAQERIG